MQVRGHTCRSDQNRLADSARGTCALFLFARVRSQRKLGDALQALVRGARERRAGKTPGAVMRD